jgi:hypothetical protein
MESKVSKENYTDSLRRTENLSANSMIAITRKTSLTLLQYAMNTKFYSRKAFQGIVSGTLLKVSLSSSLGGSSPSSMPRGSPSRKVGSDKGIFSSFKLKLFFSLLSASALFGVLESILARAKNEQKALRKKRSSLFYGTLLRRRKEPRDDKSM